MRIACNRVIANMTVEQQIEQFKWYYLAQTFGVFERHTFFL